MAGSVRVDRTEWRQAPVALAQGAIEVAVGDVHGHSLQLTALVEAIARETAGAATITFLGDLVDRGPDSLGALRLAAGDAAAIGFRERHLLLGNHEILMLLALSPGPDAPDAQELWLTNGGGETIAQAGLGASALALRTQAAAEQFRETLGAAAWDVVSRAPLGRGCGNLVFVHAGIDPRRGARAFIDGAPRLAISTDYHPAWIRWDFLDHDSRFEDGVLVVHGHTPEPRVLARKGRPSRPGTHAIDHWRLGLDGGSYATGIVAGAEFQPGRYRVFTASA